MKLRSLLFSLIATSLATPAFAGVGKVSSPDVTKGKAEVEYIGVRHSDDRKSLNNKQAHTLEVEYGFTDNFKMGLEGKTSRKSADGHEFKAYGIEAQYELTQQGNWWLDSAIKGEFLIGVENNPDEVELKWLGARSYGASKLVVNLGLSRELGENRGHGLDVSSRLQASHAYNEHFAPGFEWHGDHRKLSNLSGKTTREYYLGPIVKGELAELAGGEIEYLAGYYWGLNDTAADSAARLQLSYEVKF